MKRTGSRGARGFVGWVAMVLAVVLLVGPALREPTQYAMAQTNPAPAAKPPLDISGIAEIQKIPVGESESYELKEVIDRIIKKYGEEAKEFFNLIPAELILTSIANLAIMQMGLVGRDKFNVYRNEESLPEGTFGWVLQQILGIDPERDFGLSVEHTKHVERVNPAFNERYFLLTINYREIELHLVKDFGCAEKRLDYGIRGLTLIQYVEDGSTVPKTEERELAINRDKETGEFYAYYTICILNPNGTIAEWEQWKFVQGNPNPVSHRPMGPP